MQGRGCGRLQANKAGKRPPLGTNSADVRVAAQKVSAGRGSFYMNALF